MKPTEEIERWRRRIDEIDQQIVDLLNERSRCALAIGAQKRTLGRNVYDPEREAAIVERVREANHGPLEDEAIHRLFERILDESRRLERMSAGNVEIDPVGEE